MGRSSRLFVLLSPMPEPIEEPLTEFHELVPNWLSGYKQVRGAWTTMNRRIIAINV